MNRKRDDKDLVIFILNKDNKHYANKGNRTTPQDIKRYETKEATVSCQRRNWRAAMRKGGKISSRSKAHVLQYLTTRRLPSESESKRTGNCKNRSMT